MQRAVKRLANRLRVESIKKTNLIAISYDASEPQLAARVLQSLSKIYLQKHVEVHRPAGQLRFFDQQAAESRERLEDTKRKLLVFTKTHGLVQAAQQRDLMLRQLDDVETNYRRTQVEISETEHRVRRLNSELAELQPRTTTQVRTADNPELLRALKASLLDLKLKKIQLLTKFEPTHRLVQEVEQQISQAQSAIAAEASAPLRDETTDKNSPFEWALAEKEKASVDAEGLAARKFITGAQVVEYRSRAQRLAEDAITQDDLMSSEKAAEENYLLYVNKREEARMGDALDEGGIVNVAIAEEPVAPALPLWSSGVIALAFRILFTPCAGLHQTEVESVTAHLFRGLLRSYSAGKGRCAYSHPPRLFRLVDWDGGCSPVGN